MTRARPLLRPARTGDAAGVAAIYAPIVRDTPISFELDPPDAREMERRIRERGGRLPWLVCAQAEQVLGYAYAAPHRRRAAYRWSVEVSVYVAEAARGRGVGAGLYTGLFGILRLQGHHRAQAGITLPNPGSVALHEGLGFRPVGVYREVGFKHGRWHDVGWWERGLAEPGSDPAEPVPFAEVADAPVARALDLGLARLRPAP